MAFSVNVLNFSDKTGSEISGCYNFSKYYPIFYSTFSGHTIAEGLNEALSHYAQKPAFLKTNKVQQIKSSVSD